MSNFIEHVARSDLSTPRRNGRKVRPLPIGVARVNHIHTSLLLPLDFGEARPNVTGSNTVALYSVTCRRR
jgi:hypothetical protein